MAENLDSYSEKNTGTASWLEREGPGPYDGPESLALAETLRQLRISLARKTGKTGPWEWFGALDAPHLAFNPLQTRKAILLRDILHELKDTPWGYIRQTLRGPETRC